ncbi:uncharacterized protein BJ212DRAFT_576097 [Suillus subaureus]|uniref:DUF6533 domain-containing protein n=1 Tax=Suillus subaureus TaxID=48587 RepID=A0A9P7E4V0_9AGAM|nr:uncharacterized protein BJ212DRAFT_576097 [Suillus subaureus]KAG1810924.1 hypothetical protein BJ212DRAFT_576097 [Suillus subaureus]
MEYSTDDVAAARSLQIATYIYASMTAFWIYDYACSLYEEWTFLLLSHWRKVKGLYIVTRYLPFVLLTAKLYMSFTLNENTGKCRVLDNINTGLGIVSAVCSECFFVLRTYALWNNNRILLAAMLVIIPTFVGVSIGIAFTTNAPAAYATSAIPGIVGCYQSSTSFRLFIPFLLLSAFELGLMMLTLIRALQNWRRHPSRLYVVLVKHNVFYYTCGFLFSVANIFTSMLLQYSYHTMLYDFQFMVLAILATRMHRNLWQMSINRHAHNSDPLVGILMSDMSLLNSTA